MTFHAFVERYHLYILGGALVALYLRLWFQYRRRELPRGWLNWTTLGVIYALLAVLLIDDILHPVRLPLNVWTFLGFSPIVILMGWWLWRRIHKNIPAWQNWAVVGIVFATAGVFSFHMLTHGR